MSRPPTPANPDVIWHSPSFVDVGWHPIDSAFAAAGTLTFILAVVLAASAILLSLEHRMAALWLVGASAMGGIVGLAIASRYRFRRFRRAIEAAQTDAAAMQIVEVRLRDALRTSGNPEAVAREVTEALLGGGFCDLTARINPGSALGPIQPYDVAFEPRLLNEAEASLDSLDANVSTGEGDPGPARSSAPGLPFFGALRRHMKLGLGVPIFIVVWALIPALNRGAKAGGPDWLMLAGLVVALGVILAATGLFKTARTQSLAVPGGLVLRSFRRGDSQATLRLLERRLSVLTVCRGVGMQRWGVCVGDEHGSETLIMTRSEVDELLRAWLSPLPAPSLEQMSDFH